MSIILSTKRLVLRECSVQDTAFIVRLVNTPGWLQFIGDRNIQTKKQALSYLENGPLKSYIENGFGLWLVLLKKEGTAIGICGVIKREHLSSPDIGFALLPQYFGNGYTQEIVKAVTVYSKQVLKLTHLLAIVMPENTESINVLEKSGFTFRETIAANEKDPLLLLYSSE